MTGKNQGRKPRRSARDPALGRKPPLTFLGAVDGMLGSDRKAKNLRRLVYAITGGTAVIVCISGFFLVHVAAPVGISAISTVGAVVGMVARAAVNGRRATRGGRPDQGESDTDSPDDETT